MFCEKKWWQARRGCTLSCRQLCYSNKVSVQACDFSVQTELENLSYWVWHFFHISKDVGTLADDYARFGFMETAGQFKHAIGNILSKDWKTSVLLSSKSSRVTPHHKHVMPQTLTNTFVYFYNVQMYSKAVNSYNVMILRFIFTVYVHILPAYIYVYFVALRGQRMVSDPLEQEVQQL